MSLCPGKQERGNTKLKHLQCVVGVFLLVCKNTNIVMSLIHLMSYIHMVGGFFMLQDPHNLSILTATPQLAYPPSHCLTGCREEGRRKTCDWSHQLLSIALPTDQKA